MIGDFIWYEYMAADVEAAQRFYGEVVGYSIIPPAVGAVDYRMWALGDIVLGGLMPVPPEAAAQGARPCWLGYIGVKDVDDTVDALIADGCSVKMRPTTIPNIGRLALLGDREGAAFYVMAPTHGGALTSWGSKRGQCGWNEHHGRDSDAAAAFYARHFGWEMGTPLDMGSMGRYHYFSTNGVPAGGLMTNPQVPHPAWLFYLNTEDINAAKDRITAAGGRVLFGPQKIPTGEFVLTAIDPEGAVFGLRAPQ